jgi:hypothetical protein
VRTHASKLVEVDLPRRAEVLELAVLVCHGTPQQATQLAW